MSLDPQAVRAFEHAGWQQAASGYGATFARATCGFVDDLLDAAQVGAGMQVLDLACGPGLVAGTSRLRGALPTGLHFAAAMIGLARAAHAEDLLRVLDTTGFAQIEAHKVNLEWRFAAAGDLIEGFRQGTVRTAALIGVQPASALPAIAVAIARGIAAYRGPDGFAVPMVALLASGVRSLEPDRDQRRKTAASSRCGVHMNWSTGVTRSRR